MRSGPSVSRHSSYRSCNMPIHRSVSCCAPGSSRARLSSSRMPGGTDGGMGKAGLSSGVTPATLPGNRSVEGMVEGVGEGLRVAHPHGERAVGFAVRRQVADGDPRAAGPPAPAPLRPRPVRRRRPADDVADQSERHDSERRRLPQPGDVRGEPEVRHGQPTGREDQDEHGQRDDQRQLAVNCRGTVPPAQEAQPAGDRDSDEDDDDPAGQVVLPVAQRRRGDGDRPLRPARPQEAEPRDLRDVPLPVAGGPHRRRFVVPAPRPSRHARILPVGTLCTESTGRGGAAVVSVPSGRLDGVSAPDEQPYRSGFACLVGRPNAGKTTLTNAMVGTKVGIVSNRPQTTRHAIRGVLTRPGGQLVLVDTPGLHKPRSLLGRRLNDVVRDTLADVDVIVFCIPADQPVGTGDRFIARQLKEFTAPVVVVVTKTDAASKKQVAEQLVAASSLVDAAEVVPVSAVEGDQVELLEDLLVGLLPEGPQMYPQAQRTDDDVERQIAELIREAALEKVYEEVPHSLAVTVEELIRRPDPKKPGAELVEVHALLHVERQTQKPMLLGRGGSIIKQIGTEARTGMETLLGARVHLELHVTVLGEWQDDPKKLNRLGY